MLTLIRPLKDAASDHIEVRLKEMLAAYEVIHKEVSNIPYLIESGIVMQGEAIINFLDQHKAEQAERKSVPSDGREIG